MRALDIILNKRGGGKLSPKEISFMVNGYVSGEIPDYQMAAFLMAVWFKGMDMDETTALTLSMADSGDKVDLSAIPGIKADKHSTGGVADTATLLVGPLVAACGGKVAKMSGRGLGHTGGTIDKLESIPGFNTALSMEKFIELVSSIGLSVIGQTGNLVPADKQIYALRDVTGTVDNISLIAASVMSKKIAAGSDAIVLDVKTGSGAFMRKKEDAEELARVMVDIGKMAGRRISALVTDMNQPLGNAIGNALEVKEAVEILQGKIAGGDLLKVSKALAVEMLLLSKKASSSQEAADMIDRAVSGGEALNRLKLMVHAQGGNSEVCDNTDLLPRAGKIIPVFAEESGWVGSMDNEAIGSASQILGAGREKKEDLIDPAVGIWMKKRLGDSVEKGEILAEFHVNDEKNLQESMNRFKKAFRVEKERPVERPLIYTKIS